MYVKKVLMTDFDYWKRHGISLLKKQNSHHSSDQTFTALHMGVFCLYKCKLSF